MIMIMAKVNMAIMVRMITAMMILAIMVRMMMDMITISPQSLGGVNVHWKIPH